MPPTEVTLCGFGDARQRDLWTTGRGGNLHDIQRPPEQIRCDDVVGAGTDVNSERHERLVIDSTGTQGPPDRATRGEVCAFAEAGPASRRAHLTVDRGDAQGCESRNRVAANGPARMRAAANTAAAALSARLSEEQTE